MQENEELISYIKRAFELREQECYKQAIEMLYKAISLEPDNIEILIQLGELYFKIGNFTRSLQFAERILELDKNNLNALILQKNIYLKREEYYPAKEISEKIYSIDKNFKNLACIVKIFCKLELFDELDKYKDEIYKNSTCIYELAKAYYMSANYSAAQEILNTALSINPDDDNCKILQGRIYFDNNDISKSYKILSEYFNNSNDPEILNYKGLFALEENNFIDAIKSFSKASNLDKNNSKYIFNLANAYFLNGWITEAITTYKNAINLSPDNWDYRFSLAYTYFQAGDYLKAKTEADFILSNNNTHSGANVISALINFKENKIIEAEKILLNNINRGNEDNFTLSSLAKIQTSLCKFNSAENILNKLISQNPENMSYYCDLAEIKIAQKEYSAAVKIAEQLIEKDKNYIYAYILGAKSSYKKEDYENTKKYSQEALSIDINCAEGYYYLALVRIFEKDYEEAIECMLRAILYDVNNPEYYAKIAELYKLTGDNKTAFEYIKEAENIDPTEKYKELFREYAKLNRK